VLSSNSPATEKRVPWPLWLKAGRRKLRSDGGLARRLIAGKLAPEVQFEVSEAAKKRPARGKNQAVAGIAPEGRRPCRFRMSLAGGDPIAEEDFSRASHRPHVSSATNARAATALWARTFPKSARKRDRAYILESVIYPNKRITEGYQVVVLDLTDGHDGRGPPLSEANGEIKVETVNGTGKPET